MDAGSDRTDSQRMVKVRIPGAARLPEREARKLLVPLPDGSTREIVLVRLDGELHALDSLCPHEGGRLAEGPLWGAGHLVCPLHLYRFDPRTGAAVDVDCEPARTFVVREVDGAAELELPLDHASG
jgi:nitrite reductase/ring-hydroxylating ferredoxin subunit